MAETEAELMEVRQRVEVDDLEPYGLQWDAEESAGHVSSSDSLV